VGEGYECKTREWQKGEKTGKEDTTTKRSIDQKGGRREEDREGGREEQKEKRTLTSP